MSIFILIAPSIIVLSTGHYVYDTKREDFISIDKLVYFDSYNGVNQSVLCRLYDHQEQTKELTQDLLQEFSFCHPNGAKRFQDVLLKGMYPTVPMVPMDCLSRHDNPCLLVLFRYDYTKVHVQCNIIITIL